MRVRQLFMYQKFVVKVAKWCLARGFRIKHESKNVALEVIVSVVRIIDFSVVVHCVFCVYSSNNPWFFYWGKCWGLCYFFIYF